MQHYGDHARELLLIITSEKWGWCQNFVFLSISSIARMIDRFRCTLVDWKWTMPNLHQLHVTMGWWNKWWSIFCIYFPKKPFSLTKTNNSWWTHSIMSRTLSYKSTLVWNVLADFFSSLTWWVEDVELCCDWLEHEKFYGATSKYIAD